jgi:hypothetical protein
MSRIRNTGFFFFHIITTYHLDPNFPERAPDTPDPERMYSGDKMKLIPRDEVKEVLLVIQEV